MPNLPLQVVSFDAFNTLLTLDRPFIRLQNSLEKLGFPLPLPVVTVALKREICYYRQHSSLVATFRELSELRRACAQVVLEGLAEQGFPLALTPEALVPPLLASLHFVLYPEVPEVLAILKERGVRLTVISNWDLSLFDVLRCLGVGHRFDQVLPSALAGRAKPDPALFRQAMAGLQVPPQAALHVGDSYEQDVLPARKAGLQALLLLRGASSPPEGVPYLRDLWGVVKRVG